LVEAALDSEPFADDGDQHIDADGDPDLGRYRVLAGSVERLDAQVHLDPAKENLDLPALLVDLRDGQCGQREVVGQKHQSLAGNGIEIADAAQCIRICRGRSDGCQGDSLV